MFLVGLGNVANESWPCCPPVWPCSPRKGFEMTGSDVARGRKWAARLAGWGLYPSVANDGSLLLTPADRITDEIAATVTANRDAILAELSPTRRLPAAEEQPTAGAEPNPPAPADSLRTGKEQAEPAPSPTQAGGGPKTTAQAARTAHAAPAQVLEHPPESDPFEGLEYGEEEPRPWPPPIEPERWTEETRELVDWFRTAPPGEPFTTPGGLRVTDPGVYWRFLADWVSEGDPSTPGLTANLRQLRAIVG